MVADLRERLIAAEHDHQPDQRCRQASSRRKAPTPPTAPARCAAPSSACWRDPLSEELLEGKWTSGSVVQANVSEDGASLAFVPGTGSIPAPRKHDNIARDAELLLTNFDLGHAGVSGSGGSASGGAAD